MNKKNIEEKVKTAVENSTPDMISEIKADAMSKEQSAAPIMASKPSRKKNWLVRRLAIGFMCIAVLICGGIGIYGYNANHAVASEISFDVNPSMTMTVNKKERVLSVTANNADAERVLEGLDFSGSTYEVAVNAIIGSMLRTGYLSELSNSVLVSVKDGNAARSKDIETKLFEEIERIFTIEKFDGAILTQSLTDNSELSKLAEEYGITMGKANLINHILVALENSKVAEGGTTETYTFRDLVGFTINELNVLAQSLNIGTDDISSSGTASKEGYIGDAAALEKALGYAGVDQSALTGRTETEMDYEHGAIVYEVSFRDGTYEYECDLNALTGEFVKLKKEVINKPQITGEIKTEAEISELSKAAAGLDAQAEIKNSETEYDREDREYEIKFVSGDFKYEIEILEDGTIISVEKEMTGSFQQGGGQHGNRITEAEAKSIVMGAAAVKAERYGIEFNESLITEYECETERENGVWIYEIEFKCSGFEFEYLINASNGAVIKGEAEKG